jgi:hypothetical protein
VLKYGMDDFKCIQTITFGKNNISSIALYDKCIIIPVGCDIRVYEMKDKYKCVRRIEKAHKGDIMAIAKLPNDDFITSAMDKFVKIWGI